MPIGTVLFFIVMVITAVFLVGALVAFLNPAIKNKAGPNWLWSGRRYDPVRNIFFRQDGSFRRFGRAGLSIILGTGLVLVLSILVSVAWHFLLP